jgi:thiol-disulfide isomerase/thioredoxin
MKLLTLISLLSCSPAALEVEEISPSSDSSTPPLPPVGVIPADDCRHLDRGDKACNFSLLDQYGASWELYNYSDHVIVLDFSTVWCYPCQMAGHHAQPLQDQYSDENVQFVTILLDGAISGIEPTEEEMSEWVSSHAITTAPILQGSRDKMLSTDGTGLDGYLLGGFPTYIYIDREMKIYSAHVGFNDQHVKQTIEEGL